MPPASATATAFDPARWHTTTIERGGLKRVYTYHHCRGCLRLFYLPSSAKHAEALDYDTQLLEHQSECTMREGRLP